jgi:hypothetical protein
MVGNDIEIEEPVKTSLGKMLNSIGDDDPAIPASILTRPKARATASTDKHPVPT